MGSSHRAKSIRVRTSKARSTKPTAVSIRGLKIDLPAVIRSLETTRSIGDVLYRALRGENDLNFEEATARVLRESILDELDRVLDMLHGLPRDES